MTQDLSSPQSGLFDRPFEIQTTIVPVSEIQFPTGDEVNPAVEKPGVLQSVLLARTGNPVLPYRVIDGKRRVRSAVKYGHERVPAIITDGSRGQIAAASALLNAARNSNPLDEARNWKTALEEGQYLTVHDLARDVRVSASTIKKRLNLLRLPETLLVHVGVLIADGVAERMANLADEYLEQAITAAEQKLDQSEKFTAQDLKDSQTRKAADLQGSLNDLFGASDLPELFERPDPVLSLVSEVQRLAALHGVSLQRLIEQLQGQAEARPVAVNVEAQPEVQGGGQPTIPVSELDGGDWLGGLGTAAPGRPEVQAAIAPPNEDGGWLDDLFESGEVRAPDLNGGRTQLGLRSA